MKRFLVAILIIGSLIWVYQDQIVNANEISEEQRNTVKYGTDDQGEEYSYVEVVGLEAKLRKTFNDPDKELNKIYQEYPEFFDFIEKQYSKNPLNPSNHKEYNYAVISFMSDWYGGVFSQTIPEDEGYLNLKLNGERVDKFLDGFWKFYGIYSNNDTNDEIIKKASKINSIQKKNCSSLEIEKTLGAQSIKNSCTNPGRILDLIDSLMMIVPGDSELNIIMEGQ